MSAGDPWAGVRVLLVDGNNLLHATGGDAGDVPRRGLLARLAAQIPTGIEATLVLDGAPDPGAPMHSRIRPGLEIRHSGRLSADAVLLRAVEARPFESRDSVVVVSNDIALGDAVRRSGGRARPVAWLEQRLATPPRRTPGSSIGGPRPTAAGGGPAGGRAGGTRRATAGTAGTEPGPGVGRDDGSTEDDRRPWRPGRGATRKRGNPRRGR